MPPLPFAMRVDGAAVLGDDTAGYEMVVFGTRRTQSVLSSMVNRGPYSHLADSVLDMVCRFDFATNQWRVDDEVDVTAWQRRQRDRSAFFDQRRVVCFDAVRRHMVVADRGSLRVRCFDIDTSKWRRLPDRPARAETPPQATVPQLRPRMPGRTSSSLPPRAMWMDGPRLCVATTSFTIQVDSDAARVPFRSHPRHIADMVASGAAWPGPDERSGMVPTHIRQRKFELHCLDLSQSAASTTWQTLDCAKHDMILKRLFRSVARSEDYHPMCSRPEELLLLKM